MECCTSTHTQTAHSSLLTRYHEDISRHELLASAPFSTAAWWISAPLCSDPAAEAFQYPVSLDIRDLVTLEDVMEELGLGPNG